MNNKTQAVQSCGSDAPREKDSEVTLTTQDSQSIKPYDEFLDRFRQGEWRAKIFRDIVLSEFGSPLTNPVLLDIGCGSGFDGSKKIQASLAKAGHEYIGVEPDPDADENPEVFTSLHRNTFENCDLESNSIDIAFSVMVLEHLSSPGEFWQKLFDVLKPGGVFWGFTMDKRHFFCLISTLMESTRVKDLYLRLFLGKRGTDRYENFPTCYKANSPGQIRKFTHEFSRVDFVNFSKIGQLDSYIPWLIRPIFRAIDYLQMKLRLPGSVLAVRMQK